jgi:hypothetical protein
MPLPSSTLLPLIPATLLGLGRRPAAEPGNTLEPPVRGDPICFVGLLDNERVGLRPPPVACLSTPPGVLGNGREVLCIDGDWLVL